MEGELVTAIRAEGNAVVVQQILAAQGHQASVRTVQRVAAPIRGPAK